MDDEWTLLPVKASKHNPVSSSGYGVVSFLLFFPTGGICRTEDGRASASPPSIHKKKPDIYRELQATFTGAQIKTPKTQSISIHPQPLFIWRGLVPFFKKKDTEYTVPPASVISFVHITSYPGKVRFYLA